jgi:hypothetical protein
MSDNKIVDEIYRKETYNIPLTKSEEKYLRKVKGGKNE